MKVKEVKNWDNESEWQCGQCGAIWDSEDLADNCCQIVDYWR